MLSGCFGINSLKPSEVSAPVRIINTTSYPDLPDMSKPAKMNLIPPVWDVPRDLTADMDVKRLTDCINTTEDKRNTRFWAKCGEYPHIEKSNIFRGLSRDEFNTFLIMWKQIKNQLEMYSERIDLVNEQRGQWRQQIEDQNKELNTDE